MVGTLDEKSIIQSVSFLRERLEEEQRTGRLLRESIKQLEREVTQLKQLLKLEKLRSETAESALQGLSTQLSEKSAEAFNSASFQISEDSIAKLPNVDSIKSLIYNSSPAASWGSASEKHDQEDLNDQLGSILNGKSTNLLNCLKSALAGVDFNGVQSLGEKNDGLNSEVAPSSSHVTNWKEFTSQLTKRRESRAVAEMRLNEMCQRMMKELSNLSRSRIHEEACFDYVISLIGSFFQEANNEEQRAAVDEEIKPNDETIESYQSNTRTVENDISSSLDGHLNDSETVGGVDPSQLDEANRPISLHSKSSQENRVPVEAQNIDNLPANQPPNSIEENVGIGSSLSKQDSFREKLKPKHPNPLPPFESEFSPYEEVKHPKSYINATDSDLDLPAVTGKDAVENNTSTRAHEIYLRIQRLNRKSSLSSENSFDSGKWRIAFGGKDTIFPVSNLSIPNENRDDYLNGRDVPENFPPSENNSVASTPNSAFAVMSSPNPTLSEHKFEFHSDADSPLSEYPPEPKSYAGLPSSTLSESSKGRSKVEDDYDDREAGNDNEGEKGNRLMSETSTPQNNVYPDFKDEQSEISPADLHKILKETYVEPTATDLVDQINLTKRESKKSGSGGKSKSKTKDKNKKKNSSEDEPPYIEPSATDLVEQYKNHMKEYSLQPSSSKPRSPRSGSPSTSPSRSRSPSAPATPVHATDSTSDGQPPTSKINRSNSRNRDHNIQYNQPIVSPSGKHPQKNVQGHHPSDHTNVILQMEQAPEAYAENRKSPKQTPRPEVNATLANDTNNNNKIKGGANNNTHINANTNINNTGNAFVKTSSLRGTSLTPLHIPPRAPAVEASNAASIKFSDPRVLNRTGSNRSVHTPVSNQIHNSPFPPVAPLVPGSSDSSVLSSSGRGLNSNAWVAVGENSPAWESPRDINIRETTVRNMNVSGVLSALNAVKSEINSVLDHQMPNPDPIIQPGINPMLSMDGTNSSFLQQAGVIRIPTNSSDISSSDFHASQHHHFNYHGGMLQPQQQQFNNFSYAANSPLPNSKLIGNHRMLLQPESISSSVHHQLHNWIATPSVGSSLGSSSKYRRSVHDSPDSATMIPNTPTHSNFSSVPMAMPGMSRMGESGILNSDLDRSLNMESSRSNLNQTMLINRGLHEFTPPV